MVNGQEKFADHFAAFEGQYVLIGGTAVVAALESAGLEARATKDLDIVLCVEVLDPAFVGAFWEFIKLGGYQTRERASGKREFFRFLKPTDPSFPSMLELFSRKPDVLKMAEGQTIVTHTTCISDR